MFGGNDAAARNDTWEFDGAQWLQRTTAANPGPRHGASMVYDVGSGSCVLYGGKVSTVA